MSQRPEIPTPEEDAQRIIHKLEEGEIKLPEARRQAEEAYLSHLEVETDQETTPDALGGFEIPPTTTSEISDIPKPTSTHD